MKKKTLIAGGVCLLAVFLFLAVTGCMPATPVSSQELDPVSESQVQQALFTEQPVPTETAEPVPLSENPSPAAPLQTSAPKPPATIEVVATARSAITLGELRTVEEAGFAFRPVLGYNLHLKPDQATLVNGDGTIILSMSGVLVSSIGPLEDHMNQLLSGVGEGMEEFKAGSTYPVEVGQRNGLAADISGRMEGEKVAGQVVMVAASEDHLFYYVALVVEQPGGEEKASEGDQAIEAVIDSVTFVDPAN